MSESDAAFAVAFSDAPLSPAILAEDGRGAVSILNAARDRAVEISQGLNQIQVAGVGLTRVQQLVGRLHDVAVVALDRGLHPAERAALQRQVDLVLREIDGVAEETMLDDGWLHESSGAARSQPSPFRAIGTAALGLGGLAVRSADQALAAAGALDVATARLERSAGVLNGASSRLQDELTALTSPTTTATGQGALNSVAAASATLRLTDHLAANPVEAIHAQAGLDSARVQWLLERSPD